MTTRLLSTAQAGGFSKHARRRRPRFPSKAQPTLWTHAYFVSTVGGAPPLGERSSGFATDPTSTLRWYFGHHTTWYVLE
jgi:hypothetical protein